MELLQLVDVIKIWTYDGETHFIVSDPSQLPERLEQFATSLQNAKFVVVGGVGIATRSIRMFKIDKIPKMYLDLSKEQIEELELYKKQKYEKIGRKPTEKELLAKIATFFS